MRKRKRLGPPRTDPERATFAMGGAGESSKSLVASLTITGVC
jgi:hypothetical protein